MILYPLIKLLCCANFEKIDENQNVGAPLKEAEITEVAVDVGSMAPKASLMERGDAEGDAAAKNESL